MKVTITGIDDVLAKLKKVSEVDEAIKAAILTLLQEAEKIVLQAYALQGGGNADFHTDIQMGENSGVLYISGEDVGFLEFGAGTTVATSDEFVQEVGYEVYSGSWSIQHEGQFYKRGYWYWKRNARYQYLFPTRGAEKALNYIRNHWREVVEKKVNEWIG